MDAAIKNVNWDETSNNILKELLSWLQSGKEFVAEQVPELVNEVINWGLCSHIVFLVISGTIFLASLIILWWAIKRDFFTPCPDNVVFFIGLPNMLALVISLVVSCYQIYVIVYISVAPRLYLLERLAKMVK